MTHWYVARTRTGSEMRALWHLNNQGYSAYLPRYRKKIRHARRVEISLRPLFPGYIFVLVDEDTPHWRPINSTVGVIELVSANGRPQAVPDSIIDNIRAREDQDGVVTMMSSDLHKGDEVLFHDGILSDARGLLSEVSDDQRVVVLMKLMGREVRVRTSMDCLVRAS